MSTLPKFRFILQTVHSDNRISEVVLAKTDSRDRSAMIRRKLEHASGLTRQNKKVRVWEVSLDRFRVFVAAPKLPPVPGALLPSIDALADALDANPNTLRAAICKGKGASNGRVTVRGVTYAYAK
jgi:hypothetical protein